MTVPHERDRKPKDQRRVVVTGIGAITPLGLNAEDSWKEALAGRSGIGPITRYDSSASTVHIAGEVKGFNADEYIPHKEQKKMDLFIQYAIAASEMALQSSKLELTENVKDRTGVIIGVGLAGITTIEEQHQRLMEKGPGRITPFFVPMVITNMAAGQVSIRYGLRGPNYCITSACASGAHSIGEAARNIRDGFCDVMIAGGTEAAVSPLAVGGFASMKALSTRNDDPSAASRPFDTDRDGFVLSEGAGILVLEEYQHALERGAPILAELTGYGFSSDAHHMTNPAPGGAGAARAMQMALSDGQIEIEEINYINAHGTSTPVGDELESRAIRSIFKEHADKLWVSSTKSVMGHALGAAGAIESVFCVQALRDQVVPPTANLKNPSEGCDLDYVPHEARKGKIDNVMNNSFGFGGTNASLIFSRSPIAK